jgi:GTP-binding protein Era
VTQIPGEELRSGFVCIVGRPNVGKSSLLNQLVGRKVAITASKPQTTRNRILGVVSGAGFQLVLIDTPGIHKPHHLLGEQMVRIARNAMKETEAILFVVEGDQQPGPGDRYVAAHLQHLKTPVFCAVNKIDLVPAGEQGRALAAYAALAEFRGVLAVSALTGEGLQELLGSLVEILPPGPRYFPPEAVSDQPERLVIAELIREKLITLTEEEVPHSLAVDVEELARRPNGLVYARCVVYVERESQRGIIIGAGGAKLKEAGRLAREELERLLGSRLYLDLWVKVNPGWRNREGALRRLGYR